MQAIHGHGEVAKAELPNSGGRKTVSWIAYTPADPTLLPALLSTIVRLHEEFQTSHTIVSGFHREKTAENWELNFRRELESCCPQLSRMTVARIYHQPPVKAVNWAEVIHNQLKTLGREVRVMFSATPASRMLAAEGGLALGRLLARNPENYAMAYVDFFWGQWRGLYYPLTPRAAHPIHVARPGYLEAQAREEREPPKQALPTGIPERLLGRNLGVLREGVARLALALNRVTPLGLWALSGDSLPLGPEVKFYLRVGGAEPYEGKVTLRHSYDMESWMHALRSVRGLLNSLGENTGGGEEVFQLHGLAGLQVMALQSRNVGESESDRLSHLAEDIIIDTNMIYNGVHNEAHLGARIVVPECVVAEIHRRYAEALKKKRDSRKALDLLAFAALLETLVAGAVVAPSPSPPCDTALPNMNPLILNRGLLATLDEGARRYWAWHPGTRAESVVQMRLRDLEESVRERGEPLYALLQGLVVAGLYAYHSQGSRGETSVSLVIACEGREERVNLGRLAEKLLHPPASSP